MRAIYYVPETGQITKCIDAINEIIVANKADNEEFIEGYVEKFEDYMVVNQSLVKKQEFDFVIDGNVISNIPIETYVIVGLQSPVLVNDGFIELSGVYSQEIIVYFYNVTYIAKQIKVQYEAGN